MFKHDISWTRSFYTTQIYMGSDLRVGLTRDFQVQVFHESVSPGLLSIPLKGQCHEIFCFWFFHESVSWQQHRQQICHRYQRHRRQILPSESLVLLIPVANLPPVSTIPAGCVDTGSNFAAGIVDTGGKFATGVVDTGGAPWLAIISANFRKNSKRSYWDTLGLGGNWFIKKTRSKKSRDTVPLTGYSLLRCLGNWFMQKFWSWKSPFRLPSRTAWKNYIIDLDLWCILRLFSIRMLQYIADL